MKTSTRRHLVRIGLPVLAIALGACGSSSKPSAAPATTEPAATVTTEAPTTTTTTPAIPDACTLVPQAKAEAAIGTKLTAGTQVANSDVNSCTYPGDPNGPTAQVEVFVGPGAKKYYDDDNSVLHHTFTTVAGLGDESHEEDYTIFFRKGTTWVALRLTSLDDFSTFKARLEALATDVASKI
jgi:hypothetical protein